WRQFQALEGVLEDYDYVYDSRPTDAGLMAAALRVENELFDTEVLRSNAWEKLDAAGLAALLTALTTEDLRPDVRIYARMSGKVVAALQQLRPVERALRAAQARHRVEVPVRLHDAACGRAQLWAGGAAWEEVAGAAEMDEGDIVHLLRRLLDLLRQIPAAPGAAPRLVELATAAARAIDREPVNEVL